MLASKIKKNIDIKLTISAFLFFILFKILFPNPDFFLDSSNYLAWGLEDYKIAYRPLGYSKYLMLFNDTSFNYFKLVLVNYLVFYGCSYFFLYVLFQIINVNNYIKWSIYVLFYFNPLTLFIINLIGPDSLFISLSLMWLATFIKIFSVNSSKMAYVSANILCLFFLLHLRLNAIYYPFFAIAILLFLRKKNYVFICIISFVTTAFYVQTCKNSEQEVGISKLSGFGGWISANNATHIINKITIDSLIFESNEEKELNSFVSIFKDSIQFKKNTVTDQFMWGKSSPYKQYLFYKLSKGEYSNYLQGWWQISSLYNAYSAKLIRHYPIEFLETFYFPNISSYLRPPTEVLGKYNIYDTKISEEHQKYFDYNKDRFSCRYPNLQEHIVDFLQIIYIFFNAIVIICTIGFSSYYLSLLIRKRTVSLVDKVLFLLSSFYILSILILSFAHPLLFRYVAMFQLYFIPLPIFIYVLYFKKDSIVKTKLQHLND